MAELTAQVSRVIKAPIGRVFAAWTTPEQMKQWYSPEGMTTPQAASENRQGGKYSVTMKMGDHEFVQSGEYLEFDEPHKLVYTWGNDTIVTVTFQAKGSDQTEVTLTHTGFTTEDDRGQHAGGWSTTFNKLEKHVN